MIKQGDWVTDGERAGVVVGIEVMWLGGGTSPASDDLAVLSPEEAQRALVTAGAAENEGGGT